MEFIEQSNNSRRQKIFIWNLIELNYTHILFIDKNIPTLGNVWAKLIFTLYHNDRATLDILQESSSRNRQSIYFFVYFRNSVLSLFIFHTWYILQPPRIPAEFPLGTNIRSGTKDDHHHFLPDNPYIFRQILIFGKIGSTSWRFPKTYVATVLSPLLSSFASGGANISVVYGHNASL